MNLYIVRHAQSRRNIGYKDDVDTELTEVGKEQARRLGKYFHKIKIDIIYCSKLKRAKATLQEMRKYLKSAPIIYTEEISEHKMGVYSVNGKDDWKSYGEDAEKSGKEFEDFKPKEGNSLRETYKKAGKFYKKLLKENKNVLVVGHGIFGRYLILNALNLNIEEGKYFQLSNASVSTLKIKENKITNFHINDYNHLIKEALIKQNAI